MNVPDKTRQMAQLLDQMTERLETMAEQLDAALKDRVALRMQVESLTKERDSLAADAARYRWVKKQTRAFSLDMGGQHSWTTTGGFMRARGPTLDDAIDAAMKAAS